MLKPKKPLVISFLNQKGGVGKTTLATNVAHGFTLKGYNTLLVDSDPQGSARDWHETSGGAHVQTIGLDRKTLAKDIKNLSKEYSIIIIDGAGRLAEIEAAAIVASDVVLVPIHPSQFDIWSSSYLVENIKTRQELMNGKPEAAFITTIGWKNSIALRDVGPIVAEQGLEVFEAGTTRRQAYVKVVAKGDSVYSSNEPGAADAKEEIEAIVDEIIRRYINEE